MKTIRCECGFVAHGDDDDEVIAVIQDHLAIDHPALLDAVDHETLVSWIRQE